MILPKTDLSPSNADVSLFSKSEKICRAKKHLRFQISFVRHFKHLFTSSFSILLLRIQCSAQYISYFHPKIAVKYFIASFSMVLKWHTHSAVIHAHHTIIVAFKPGSNKLISFAQTFSFPFSVPLSFIVSSYNPDLRFEVILIVLPEVSAASEIPVLYISDYSIFRAVVCMQVTMEPSVLIRNPSRSRTSQSDHASTANSFCPRAPPHD